MKTFLVFNKNGEIIESSTNNIIFNLENFPEYKYYKRYTEYILLYNMEENNKNLTVFYFTDDKYTSDVALIKINQQNVIKNLSYKNYIKKIFKIKLEKNEMIYSSDEDSLIIDTSPFTY